MKGSWQLLIWARRYTTPIILTIPLLLLALVINLAGGVVLQRIVTVLFINLTLVLGLQMFMGNSGVVSFAHIGFMGIGAYGAALFSMSAQAKAAHDNPPVENPSSPERKIIKTHCTFIPY